MFDCGQQMMVHRVSWLMTLISMLLVIMTVVDSSIGPAVNSSEPRFTVVDRWIVDQFGRVRIFHGFNSVMKSRPYYDAQILNATRLRLYQQWGFNAVRLGTMWAGAQPVRQGQFNDTYISVLELVVKQLSTFGIHVLLDMHQDVISSAFDSYDGVPRWLIDRLPPAKHKYPWPFRSKFPGNLWAMGYFTEAVSVAFQQLYDNVTGARDAMTEFWVKIASVFSGHDNILGYELINEPWAGDIYTNLSLLLPGVAGQKNLAPLYNHLNTAIRTVDKNTLIFYEPVTWSVFLTSQDAGTGFRSVPGGPQYKNRSVLSYHYYCWIIDPSSTHQQYKMWKRVFCDDVVGPLVMPSVHSEVGRLGGSSFMTEFGICDPNGDAESVDTIECEFVMRQADEYLQSWTYWDSLFFNDSLHGEINWNTVLAFARVYARAVSGIPISMNFDPRRRQFRLEWRLSVTIHQPTEVFVPQIQYPRGFRVYVSEGLQWTFDTSSSVLFVLNKAYHSATDVYIMLFPIQ